MRLGKTLIIAALPLALAVGCETSNEGKASMNDKAAMQAQNDAKRAAAAANAAAASAAGLDAMTKPSVYEAVEELTSGNHTPGRILVFGSLFFRIELR